MAFCFYSLHFANSKSGAMGAADKEEIHGKIRMNGLTLVHWNQACPRRGEGEGREGRRRMTTTHPPTHMIDWPNSSPVPHRPPLSPPLQRLPSIPSFWCCPFLHLTWSHFLSPLRLLPIFLPRNPPTCPSSFLILLPFLIINTATKISFLFFPHSIFCSQTLNYF